MFKMKKLQIVIVISVIIIGGYRLFQTEQDCSSTVKDFASGYYQDEDDTCGDQFNLINRDEVEFDVYGSEEMDDYAIDNVRYITTLKPDESYNLSNDGYYSYMFSESGSDSYWVSFSK